MVLIMWLNNLCCPCKLSGLYDLCKLWGVAGWDMCCLVELYGAVAGWTITLCGLMQCVGLSYRGVQLAPYSYLTAALHFTVFQNPLVWLAFSSLGRTRMGSPFLSLPLSGWADYRALYTVHRTISQCVCMEIGKQPYNLPGWPQKPGSSSVVLCCSELYPEIVVFERGTLTSGTNPFSELLLFLEGHGDGWKKKQCSSSDLLGCGGTICKIGRK